MKSYADFRSRSEAEVCHGGASQKNGVASQYGAYGRARQKPSLTSGLEMMTRRLGNQLE